MENFGFYYINQRLQQTMTGRLDKAELLALCSRKMVETNIKAFRSGDASAKAKLPAIFFQGQTCIDPNQKGARQAKNMVNNGKYVIDLDHLSENWHDESEAITGKKDERPLPIQLWDMIRSFNDFDQWKIQMAFITPSGNGLKLVCELTEPMEIGVAQKALVSHFNLQKWFDEVNIDYSRLAFVPLYSEIIYLSDDLFNLSEEIEVYVRGEAERWSANAAATASSAKARRGSDERVTLSEEALAEYDDYEYKGRPMRKIIEEWSQHYGTKLGKMSGGKPFAGEVNQLHFEIMKSIRVLCNDNPMLMTAMVPRYGHDIAEIFHEAQSVCKYPLKSTRLPNDIYWWMREKGYLMPPNPAIADEDEDDDANLSSPFDVLLERMPELPPIFKQYVDAAPKDFKIPVIMGLLPILGALTTYVKADYWDGESHTTSFFTTVYAPAGNGKGFVKRFYEPLTRYMVNREQLIMTRERLYDSVINTKGANEKSPEKPELIKRIFPAKFSETQLFAQTFNNRGLHLLTFCSEIDTFGRGTKGVSDLLRTAWDNDAQGQSYASSATFKGTVRLFWNVLLTGTPERVKAYFRNLEDGLITRISICPICNQEFADAPVWKKIPKTQMDRIDTIIKRFDAETFIDPMDEISEDELREVKTMADFDQRYDWKFKVRPRQERNMDYVHSPLKKWLKSAKKGALKSINKAMDMFRRRSAVKAFRAALLANELWGNPQSAAARQKIIDFAVWMADVELTGSMLTFGDAYNEHMARLNNKTSNPIRFASVFDYLPDTFTDSAVAEACQMSGVATRTREVIYRWRDAGFITKADKKTWRKEKKQ